MKANLFIIGMLIGSLLSQPGLAKDKKHHHETAAKAASADEALSGDSLYNVDATFINQDGKPVQLKSFRGQPVVISMAYTGCTYTCPLILSQMQQLEKALQEKGQTGVQFILVSFDYEKDNPSVLKAYFKKRNLSKNWTLLTSASDNEPREISNLLGIKYKKMEGGDYDHSFVITVLDSEGVIKGRQVGADGDPKKMLELLKK